MKATVERNKETEEHVCLVDGKILANGKSGKAITRVYDMADAINAGGLPAVTTTGRGDKREFSVQIGDYVVKHGLGALKAYHMLDAFEAVLVPAVSGYIQNLPAENEMVLDPRGAKPAVTVPDMDARDMTGTGLLGDQ